MMTTTEKKAGTELTSDQQAALLIVVSHIIPPSSEFDLPGADDPLIFADIVRSVNRDRALLVEALQAVITDSGGDLPQLSRLKQAHFLAEFKANHPVYAGVIESATARCYYRDDRVMASIGMAIRPPFPQGYEVEPGNWSLLDPVCKRGKRYRDAG